MLKAEGDNKIRVVCAMSGGVDSAVSAALLVKSGFDVIGVFMKFWVEKPSTGACLTQNRCCSDESEQRARATAIKLGIPFYVLDVKREFKKMIVDGFISDTKTGLTPNPCVVCNQTIKFGLLIRKARLMGAKFVATGHYAQIKKTKAGVFKLLKGKDKNKDQSYFLWRLSQDQLSRIIFPVGLFEKIDVRHLAKSWKLPSAATAESQEVCFVGKDMDKFLARHCGADPGDIIDASGAVIGRHEGLWFYTIGQRKGIRLSGGPYYVAKKDFKNNRLVVVPSLADLRSNVVSLGDVYWSSGNAPSFPLKAKARIRYRAKENTVILRSSFDCYELEFIKPVIAATPGQSAVFYKGQELLGGGIIKP